MYRVVSRFTVDGVFASLSKHKISCSSTVDDIISQSSIYDVSSLEGEYEVACVCVCVCVCFLFKKA